MPDGRPGDLIHSLPECLMEFCKVKLTLESVDEILWCDHSNESYWAVLSCGTVYYAVQGSSNFWVCGWNPMMWPFKWKLSACTFTWCYLFFKILYKIWKFGRNLPLATFGSERVNPSVPEEERMPGWLMEYNDMGVLNFEFSDETLWTASFQTNSLPEYFYLALLVFEQMIR